MNLYEIAVFAMQAMLIGKPTPTTKKELDNLAKSAYEVAEAILEERIRRVEDSDVDES